MEILRRPIHENTFDDLVNFCRAGVIEGIQLDYKKDLSDKGLAKHFAAFSNARGGLIIIGVEEDSATGKPVKYEGVDPAGKLEDRIHQYAANVDPLPRYDVGSTNPDTNGKVFILVRILEGDRTPYYVLNDANIYIRTGNITKRCEELASPQETARLFEKHENAEMARDIGIGRAELVYRSAIERFYKQHERWHRATLKTTIYSRSSVTVPDKGVCTTIIQPYYPDSALISPRHLQSVVQDMYMKTRNSWGRSWLQAHNQESIQDGVLTVDADTSHAARFSSCQAVFASGLIFGRDSFVWNISRTSDKEVFGIGVESIVAEVYNFLMASRQIYLEVKYQGALCGYIEMSSLEGLAVAAFAPGIEYRFQPRDILLPAYKWAFETDTSILFDNESLRKFFYELVNEIGWSFGWDYDHKQFLDLHIEKYKWFS